MWTNKRELPNVKYLRLVYNRFFQQKLSIGITEEISNFMLTLVDAALSVMISLKNNKLYIVLLL